MKPYKEGNAQQFSLQITEECNLRCKYCYEVHKGHGRVMSRDVAYRAIDFILSQPCRKPAVVVDFTGGESTLEISLVSDIARYFTEAIKRRKQHPWRSAYMFLLSTNGTTYGSEAVQRFLWENRFRVQAAITLDGTKRKHDMNRVFANGKGSYDIVAANVKLYVRQFENATTKVTISSEDLGYTCESIIHLWDMGIKMIAANVVFEDVWQPGDTDLFEAQLRELADRALEEDYWRTCNTTLFWMPQIAPDYPGESDRKAGVDDSNWCGTSGMMLVDCEGNLYPCVRFTNFSLAHRPGRKIGTIYDGVDRDKLRAYQCLTKSLQSTRECLECGMEAGCAWCTGYNYDVADSDTIFQRAKYLCEMHKAQVRANQYYWEQLKRQHGIYVSPTTGYAARLCVC